MHKIKSQCKVYEHINKPQGLLYTVRSFTDMLKRRRQNKGKYTSTAHEPFEIYSSLKNKSTKGFVWNHLLSEPYRITSASYVVDFCISCLWLMLSTPHSLLSSSVCALSGTPSTAIVWDGALMGLIKEVASGLSLNTPPFKQQRRNQLERKPSNIFPLLLGALCSCSRRVARQADYNWINYFVVCF